MEARAMRVYVYMRTERQRGPRTNPLVLILAIVGGITVGNLISEGEYTGALIAAITTTAIVAILLALSDYKSWDERREKNLAVAAKYTLIAIAGTLVITGGSMAVPTPPVGMALLGTGFAILFIWAAVYQYLEWRDTH